MTDRENDLWEASQAYYEELQKEKFNGIDVTNAFEAGAEWQKKQMMAKAVDGEIGYWNIRGLSVNMDLPRTLEEDDKVKLIIIKEENV